MAGQTKLFEHTVVGDRPFPIDMLRYDLAFPATETASSSIASTFGREGRRVVRSIRIKSPKRELTTGRWESFGWEVRD
jgi:hypothetical protein